MSHSTYDKNNNPFKFDTSFEERLKNHKTVYAYTKEHNEISEKLAKENGRGWWIFSGLSSPKKYQNTWIEQFRKKDER